MRAEPIGMKPPSRRRLKNERRVRRADVVDHRLAPASMMRELDHVASEIDLASTCHGGESSGGLGLDVARKKNPRGQRIFRLIPRISSCSALQTHLDHKHQRKVVVATRAESGIRPKHGPSGGTYPNPVASHDANDLRSARLERRQQLADRRRGFRSLEQRRMQVGALDSSPPRDVCERAQMVDVRMRDEGRFYAAAARRDPRDERAGGDIAHRTRSAVEEHQLASDLDPHGGAIAYREHRARKRRRRCGHAAGSRSKRDERDRCDPRRAAENPSSQHERADRAEQHRRGDPPVDRSDRNASGAGIRRKLHEPHLKP